MQFSCGNAVVKLLMACGLGGWFSSSNTHDTTRSSAKIHNSFDLSRAFHSTIHNVFTGYGNVFTHTFHSTYNYNNL